jgi:thiol-disulfide isomerase/thioredoxin
MIRAIILMMLLVFGAASAGAQAHPEARPFDESANAQRDLNVALVSAAASESQNIIVIMGANWCHDSRTLAGWFATPRFANMLSDQYRTVYVDVGVPQTGLGRNLDIAKRFGIKKVKGTPLVMVLSPDGKLLNSKKDAASWRNAASRSEDAIFRYFAQFKPLAK